MLNKNNVKLISVMYSNIIYDILFSNTYESYRNNIQ